MKLLTFRVGSKRFATGIDNIIEIIRIVLITSIPKSPSFIEGVINYRGEITPVIDIANVLKITSTGEILKRKILIIEINKVRTGIIVDTIEDIAEITKAKIKKPIKEFYDYDFLYGIFSQEEKIYLIIDFENIVSKEKLLDLKSFSKKVLEEGYEKLQRAAKAQKGSIKTPGKRRTTKKSKRDSGKSGVEKGARKRTSKSS